MQTQSPAFLAALKRSPQSPYTITEVVPGGADINTPALYELRGDAGSLSLDETRPVRRTLSGLHLLDTKGDLTPGNVGDLLHPATGNEIRIRRGLSYKRLNLLPPEVADVPTRLGLWDSWGGQLPMATDPGDDGWHGVSTTWTPDSNKDGAGSVVVNSAGTGWVQNPFRIQLTRGMTYTIVAWAKGLSGTVGGIGVGLDYYDASGNLTAPSYMQIVGTATAGVWSPIIGQITVPASGSIASGALFLQPNSTSVIAFTALAVLPGVVTDPTVTLMPGYESNWLGFFRFDTVSVTDSGAGVEITLNGMDRAKAIQKARWTAPFQPPPWTTIPQAISLVAQNRWLAGTAAGTAPLRIDFSACDGHPIMDMTIPNPVFGTDQTVADPMPDIITMAAVGGCEVFFNELGDLVVRPFINPSTIEPVVRYTESPSLSAASDFQLLNPIGREITPDRTFSGIVVTGGNSTDTGVRAVVWDTDPRSPTYVGKVGYQATEYDSPLIRNYRQALVVGGGLIGRLRLSSEVVTAVVMTNPGHEGGDGLYLQRERAKATGTYILSNYGMNLSPTGAPMQITSRSTSDIPAVTLS